MRKEKEKTGRKEEKKRKDGRDKERKEVLPF